MFNTLSEHLFICQSLLKERRRPPTGGLREAIEESLEGGGGGGFHALEVFAKAAVKLIVERFCLARCSSSLRTGRGTWPIVAPEGLGEIQILEKSVFNSCILSSKQGCPTLYHFAVEGGGGGGGGGGVNVLSLR